MVVRRNFSFWPGEKSLVNRAYRAAVDRWLARRYQLADYFFDLTQCMQENKLDRVAALARSEDVELMTHPISSEEQAYLLSDESSDLLLHLPSGGYRANCSPSPAVCRLASDR
jgi:chitin disaccharide deacetylase